MSELKPCPMTADEAISALEMCQALMLFDPMTGETHELCEENKDNQDLYNACSLAIDALRRAQPANDPLTLEQLRKMYDEPVWVVCGIYADWRIPEFIDEGGYKGFIKFTDRSAEPISDYGKNWIVYRRKPEGSENNA